ncbi:MAG TPA: hypothetical protein VF727_00190 [Allosphingosinicella sp.]|jgi:GTP cyclohydrolase III
MPLFFFHLYDELETLDEAGRPFPDAGAARDDALRNARALASEEVRHGRLNLAHRIDVADESGTIVAQVRFRDAVEIEG